MSNGVKDEIARYRELLRRDPRSRVFAPMAEACRKEGRPEEALALAREGITHHPAYAGGWLALARALLDLGRVREAAESLEHAVAAAPAGALAWRLLGEARARLRDRLGAFEALARALALDPLDDGARRAVLDIDSLIAASPPGPDTSATIPEPETLDLSLEALEEVSLPPDALPLSDIETSWLAERELSLFLVPEVSLEEGADTTFHAGRLEVLDIVHSSLAPEALAEAVPESTWELPDPEVPCAARAVSENAVPRPPEVSRPEVSRKARADSEPEVTRAARADSENARADDKDGEIGVPDLEAGEQPAPAPDLRTETLADLCAQQGHLERAREIYRSILANDPLQLRVKKKLLDLPAPAPVTEQSVADRRIADLGRWLDRARSAADRTAPGDRTGE